MYFDITHPLSHNYLNASEGSSFIFCLHSLIRTPQYSFLMKKTVKSMFEEWLACSIYHAASKQIQRYHNVLGCEHCCRRYLVPEKEILIGLEVKLLLLLQ